MLSSGRESLEVTLHCKLKALEELLIFTNGAVLCHGESDEGTIFILSKCDPTRARKID